MYAAILATILSTQAARHDAGECRCRVPVVTRYTATVRGGGEGWGGSLPSVTLVPDRVEFVPCDHAKRSHR